MQYATKPIAFYNLKYKREVFKRNLNIEMLSFHVVSQHAVSKLVGLLLLVNIVRQILKLKNKHHLLRNFEKFQGPTHF